MHRAVPVVAVSCWLNSAALGQWIPEYTARRIGLLGPEHTASDGMQFSRLVRVANNGVVFGESSRFLGTGTSKGTSLWAFDGSTTQEIGLFGPEFTGADGYEYSDFTSHYPSGIAFGTTKVIQGTDIFRGQGAWVWNGSATHRLGFFTGGYAGQYPHTRVVESNANGYAIGVSDLTMSGPQGWLWNGVECTRVGLFDANHTGPGNSGANVPRFLRGDGLVAGWSERFTSGSANGVDAWVYSGGVATEIGLHGGAFTGSDGYQDSVPSLMNASGQVAGISKRFSGARTDRGQGVWFWDGSTVRQVGLSGPIYVGQNDYQYASAEFLNDAGQLVGIAHRKPSFGSNLGQQVWAFKGGQLYTLGFSGFPYESGDYLTSGLRFQNDAGQVVGYSQISAILGPEFGRDTWVWNGAETQRIGLIGGGYSLSSGHRYSGITLQNQSGQVVGYSKRFASTGIQSGQDAWVWNGTSTQRVGLIGPGYESILGSRFSQALAQNENGQVVGYCDRYGPEVSTDLWFWDGTTTRKITPNESIYVGNAGRQFPSFYYLNSEGVVVGTSRRLRGAATDIGTDTWYFDPATGLTTVIQGSVRVSDNVAYSNAYSLTEDGYVFGEYSYFNNGVGTGQLRGFIFRPDIGFRDLETLAVGGLASQGWASVNVARMGDVTHHLAGYGVPSGSSALGSYAFTMTTTPPCTADFNLDGFLTFADFDAFVEAFESGRNNADVNNDGFFTCDDFDGFVVAFEAGC